MVSLTVHPDARRDLLEIGKTDKVAAAGIIALLQQLKADPDLMDRLTQQGYGAHQTADFEVQKFLALYRQGKNMWRLKIWPLEDRPIKYRIVYAFLPRQREHVVLGVVPRSFNYDSSNPLTMRMVDAYQNLF